jgi:hypothetical protein
MALRRCGEEGSGETVLRPSHVDKNNGSRKVFEAGRIGRDEEGEVAIVSYLTNNRMCRIDDIGPV